MDLENTIEKREILYEKYLQDISGVKFTIREIDVISCLLHNRGEKKIGALLEISHRTVSSHVRNIMVKIGSGSRDGLIDLVEKSGKLVQFRTYYFCLILRGLFEKSLKKIAALINRQPLDCGIFYENLSVDELDKINKIIADLQEANVNLYNLSKGGLYDRNFYVVGNNSQSVKQTQYNDIKIILKQDEDLSLYDKSQVQYIDFRSDESYYFSVLDLISHLVNKSQIEEIITDFSQNYNDTKKSYYGNIISEEITKNRFNKKTLIAFIIIVMLTIAMSAYMISMRRVGGGAKKINISEINQSLSEYLQTFSADNLRKDQVSRNHNVAKILENILHHQDNINDIKEYFSDPATPSDYLVNYLYHLQGLSCYYMYNHHDGQKANQILSYAKEIMETFINSRSSIVSDFDSLEPEEILSELSIIKDFPEIYTRIIYSLGRTYIYLKDTEAGRRYFTIAKYLGNRLNLLEGYLSDASGLLLIDILDSEKLSGAEKKQKLHFIIEQYEKLSKGSQIYIKDFVPNNTSVVKVDVQSDAYSKIDRFCRITNCYNELIQSSDTDDEMKTNILSLANYIQSFYQENNVDEMMNQIPSRKKAFFCNILGHTYLLLGQNDIQDEPLNKIMNDFLNISSNDNLTIAEFLYNKSRTLSRNTDFTKADAYDGLMKIYEHKLDNDKNLSQDDKEKITKQIEQLNHKRDKINSALKRKTS